MSEFRTAQYLKNLSMDIGIIDEISVGIVMPKIAQSYKLFPLTHIDKL